MNCLDGKLVYYLQMVNIFHNIQYLALGSRSWRFSIFSQCLVCTQKIVKSMLWVPHTQSICTNLYGKVKSNGWQNKRIGHERRCFWHLWVFVRLHIRYDLWYVCMCYMDILNKADNILFFIWMTWVNVLSINDLISKKIEFYILLFLFSLTLWQLMVFSIKDI